MSQNSPPADAAATFVASAPGRRVAEVVLKPGKSRPFFGRHPWVLESAVHHVHGGCGDGDEVDLLTDKGRWIARGVFHAGGRIRVRLYSWLPGETLDEAFWRERLRAALALRAALGYDAADGAARLVYSEADGLSGLIVDRYADHLVVQVTALAIARRLNVLVPLLAELCAPRGIHVRGERGAAHSEGLEVADHLAWGEAPDGPVFFQEHGVRFGVDLSSGQKTGFYLDQRENRRAIAPFVAGRRVLDMFCYAGGFSLAAARAGAREITAVDSSARALDLARANAALNGVDNIRFIADDGFDQLAALARAGERFGCVILDPPKFARGRRSIDDALRAYHRLNRLGIDVLEPGGTLVTCSCSGSVTREDFLFMLSGVAEQAGRTIQILEQRGAAPDHPVNVACPEGEYLKCFVCRVE